MNLQLSTFEQAKLLKEKGFDWKVRCVFAVTHGEVIEQERHYEYDYSNVWSDNTETEYLLSRPTLAIVCKWFRDVHGIVIIIACADDFGFWKFNIRKKLYLATKEWEGSSYQGSGMEFESYEQAQSAAIDYVLKNLI